MSSETGYLRHFHSCNRHDLNRFAPFFIDGKRYGRVKKDIVETLIRETSFFTHFADGIALEPKLRDFAARSKALEEVTALLAQRYGRTLYNEMYGIAETWGDHPVAQADRAAIPWLGVPAWGVHVNGFVRKKDGIHLWIAKRAADRSSYAGQLDNMIGGGQPIGLTVEQNLCKEAKEEAGVSESLAKTARPAGKISYLLERPDGLRTDTLFVYDLELPEDFVPHNTDGEVESFTLMPLADVAALVRDTDRFKFNCNMVITDFMMRHGYLSAQDTEYAALQNWLKHS